MLSYMYDGLIYWTTCNSIITVNDKFLKLIKTVHISEKIRTLKRSVVGKVSFRVRNFNQKSATTKAIVVSDQRLSCLSERFTFR